VKPTIKTVDFSTMTVRSTLQRDTCGRSRRPGFRKGILLKAHREFNHGEPTDDAAMVEELGEK